MKKMRTLKKNYEFQNVLDKGKFYKGNQITIYIMKDRKMENCIGIAISSKICNAVKKNAVRRKIREVYRLIERRLDTGYRIVFLWNKKVAVEQADFHVIMNDMETIFLKAGLLR